MKKLFTKLSSRRGETLIESLTSIIVITLVSAFLVGSIVAGTRMNERARELDSELQTQRNAAEQREQKEESTVQIDGSSYDIYLSGNPSDGLYAYWLK